MCAKKVKQSDYAVITCSVSTDVILLLLILHYKGSLQQSLIYTIVYPLIF